MIGAISRAESFARKALEATYNGKALITERQKARNPHTKIVEEREVPVLVDEPCHLSYTNVSAVEQAGAAAKTAQVTKLFLSPDVRIKPGSKVMVAQNGITRIYESSGVAAVYPTHQEIVLKLAEEYA